ncbi:MAG: hypothetical protein F6K58_00205 [Symploca sp. SIO2E9]|nr:hypothetical protein [Symploca sp. SIO2E9]
MHHYAALNAERRKQYKLSHIYLCNRGDGSGRGGEGEMGRGGDGLKNFHLTRKYKP